MFRNFGRAVDRRAHFTNWMKAGLSESSRSQGVTLKGNVSQETGLWGTARDYCR
jgi:hypothetical protein